VELTLGRTARRRARTSALGQKQPIFDVRAMSAFLLSPTTRTTERNLLVASVLAITYKAFHVTIDKIPVAGLSLNFDNRVFTFLLLIALVYFLCTFVLYYFIDIRNNEPTAHEVASEKAFNDSLDRFVRKYDSAVQIDLTKRFPEYSFMGDGSLGSILRNLEQMSVARITTGPRDQTKRISFKDAGTDPKLAAATQQILRRYWWRRKLYYVSLLPRLYCIRATYFVRDYLTDGILPIVLGLFAIAAVYDVVGVGWIRTIAPPQMPKPFDGDLILQTVRAPVELLLRGIF
jgi:hypothetical protein